MEEVHPTGVFDDPELVRNFFYWINERHAIYQRRAAGLPGPWTVNPVLRDYKFTNPFRENDRDTIWMRKNWTGPNEHQPWGLQIFNCAFFRMFGATDFMEEHGYITEFDPEYTLRVASARLKQLKKCFTSAYIITNQGLTLPKEQVVVNMFLTPIWEAREQLAEVARNQSLQDMHKAFGEFKGWKGGGFMAYEVVTDLNHTPVLREAKDRNTWANAGPGAVRGLNRLMRRDIEKPIKKDPASRLMRELRQMAHKYLEPHVPLEHVDLRVIEHSLCEWDKYQRVIHKQGAPRGRFAVASAREFVKGPIP